MAPKKSASRTAATGSSLETLFKKQRTDNELTAAACTATDLQEQAQIARGEYLDKLESAKSHASATDEMAVTDTRSTTDEVIVVEETDATEKIRSNVKTVRVSSMTVNQTLNPSVNSNELSSPDACLGQKESARQANIQSTAGTPGGFVTLPRHPGCGSLTGRWGTWKQGRQWLVARVVEVNNTAAESLYHWGLFCTACEEDKRHSFHSNRWLHNLQVEFNGTSRDK